MIRIQRPAAPPILRAPRGRGFRLTEELKEQHDAGERKFEFEGKVYGDRSVKQALLKAQHEKCAFCESKIAHVAYGDVEHFRPKKAVRQAKGGELQRPGYYWLAYEWTNLLASCSLCNGRHKGNLFPLRDPAARALSHADDLAAEAPLFIDPSAEEPSDWIGFREHVAFSREGNARGAATIDGLRLNRTELLEQRREALESARLHHTALAALQDRPEHRELVEKTAEFLRDLLTDAAEYAAMLRSHFSPPD